MEIFASNKNSIILEMMLEYFSLSSYTPTRLPHSTHYVKCVKIFLDDSARARHRKLIKCYTLLLAGDA